MRAELLRDKRKNGQYFTENNPFSNAGFLEWASDCELHNQAILEPFAGSNNLIHMLQEMDQCHRFVSYDIAPRDRDVQPRDTLAHFPTDFNVCITNPPYLARNSAKRRGLSYPDTRYDDLYKFSLHKCLAYCENVGAIIPASFLNAGLFRDRLSHYVLLNRKMFHETDHPVCLALFKRLSKNVKIYEGNTYVGLLNELEQKAPKPNKSLEVKFNEKTGALGLIAVDNTIGPSIRFCEGTEIDPHKVGHSSRSITRIKIDRSVTSRLIAHLNSTLDRFRAETYDIFLTPFKGLRKDHKYRRRLDYKLARDIINVVLS